MKNLTQNINTILEKEKQSAQLRMDNSKKIEKILDQKNAEINALEQKIKKVKNGITSMCKNLSVPVMYHLLASVKTNFAITAKLNFYNPDEGKGDPHWKSSDRTEEFSEDTFLEINSINFFFINAYPTIAPEDLGKQLFERTHLIIGVEFSHKRAEGILWLINDGTHELFKFRTDFDAISKNETEKLSGVTLDLEKLLSSNENALDAFLEITKIFYLPGKFNSSFDYSMKKVCQAMIPLQSV